MQYNSRDWNTSSYSFFESGNPVEDTAAPNTEPWNSSSTDGPLLKTPEPKSKYLEPPKSAYYKNTEGIRKNMKFNINIIVELKCKASSTQGLISLVTSVPGKIYNSVFYKLRNQYAHFILEQRKQNTIKREGYPEELPIEQREGLKAPVSEPKRHFSSVVPAALGVTESRLRAGAFLSPRFSTAPTSTMSGFPALDYGSPRLDSSARSFEPPDRSLKHEDNTIKMNTMCKQFDQLACCSPPKYDQYSQPAIYPPMPPGMDYSAAYGGYLNPQYMVSGYPQYPYYPNYPQYNQDYSMYSTTAGQYIPTVTAQIPIHQHPTRIYSGQQMPRPPLYRKNTFTIGPGAMNERFPAVDNPEIYTIMKEYEYSTKNLKYLKGKIKMLATSQNGSRFLQNELTAGNSGLATMIMEEVSFYIESIILDS